jgi:hypothetical protein
VQYEAIIGCFSEYYGLRVPNVNEWLYAARGSEDVPFPWVDEWTCEDPDFLSSCGFGFGMEHICAQQCYLDNLCNNGNPMFLTCQVDGEFDECLYPGGQYDNESPFEVYDMIGNALELVVENDQFYTVGILQVAIGGELVMWQEQIGSDSICELPDMVAEGYTGDYLQWIEECGYASNLLLNEQLPECNSSWLLPGYLDEQANQINGTGIRLVRTTGN